MGRASLAYSSNAACDMSRLRDALVRYVRDVRPPHPDLDLDLDLLRIIDELQVVAEDLSGQVSESST
jgi:hypothetical protein